MAGAEARVAIPTLHGTCLDSLDTPLLGYVGALHSDTLREDLGTHGKAPALYCQSPTAPAIAQDAGVPSSGSGFLSPTWTMVLL